MTPDLFSWQPPAPPPAELPFAKGRPTSRAGAIHAAPRKGTQCDRILQALREAGDRGATACELRHATGIYQASTMSARLNGLMRDGLIYDSGQERESEYGVVNIVWRVK